MIMNRAIRTFGLATALLLVAAGLSTAREPNSGDKVGFPQNFAKGVMYTTVDRPDIKQYRELFANPEAIAALKDGKSLPSGTVLTLVQYKAQLDADGNPKKDANGRFIKGDVAGYAVMEKRAGWGTEHAPALRNGEWEYQAFTADKTVNEKAALDKCFACHKPLENRDFVFSLDAMKAAAR